MDLRRVMRRNWCAAPTHTGSLHKIGRRLLVKGSGHALASIGPEGFVELDRDALEALVKSRLSDDKLRREEQFKAAVMSTQIHGRTIEGWRTLLASGNDAAIRDALASRLDIKARDLKALVK